MTITLNGTTGITSPAIDITTPLSVEDGGTGASTLTANNVLLGNGTSAVTTVAPSTSGNILTSNGTTWVSSAPTGGASGGQVFTTSGTFTIPTGVTKIKVTLCGGGGGSGGGNPSVCGGSTTGGGGGGATAIKYLTGLTSGNTLTVTVGAAGTAGSSSPGNGGTGGSSTIASGTQTITTVTAGGGAGGGGIGDGTVTSIAAGGTATNGDINITGGRPSIGALGSYTVLAMGGTSTFSNSVGATGTSGAVASSGYGMGGQGIYNNSPTTGKAGSAGIVVIEW